MRVEFENGSVIESTDIPSVKNNVRAGNTRYREWTDEEVENFKNMLKDIKDNLYRFYKR